MTRLCTDRASQSFAFDADPFIVACVYIYHSSYVHLCHFFFSLLLPLSFPLLSHRSKDVAPHTRPLYIRFASNSISFLSIHPFPHRSSIHTRQFTTLVDNVAINIAITIACSSHRWPARFLWPPFNFINSRERRWRRRKIRRVHAAECQLVSPTEITILSVITSTRVNYTRPRFDLTFKPSNRECKWLS